MDSIVNLILNTIEQAKQKQISFLETCLAVICVLIGALAIFFFYTLYKEKTLYRYINNAETQEIKITSKNNGPEKSKKRRTQNITITKNRYYDSKKSSVIGVKTGEHSNVTLGKVSIAGPSKNSKEDTKNSRIVGATLQKDKHSKTKLNNIMVEKKGQNTKGTVVGLDSNLTGNADLSVGDVVVKVDTIDSVPKKRSSLRSSPQNKKRKRKN